MSHSPRFELRARFAGVLDWLCPFCGHMNRSRVARTSWRVKCKAKPCRRQFAIGAVFHSLATLQGAGRRTLPPADVTFPVATLDCWVPGGPVNKLILDNEEAEIAG